MGHICITDDALIASYFDGSCSNTQKAHIQQSLVECAECRGHFAQLSYLLESIPEPEDTRLVVSNALTERALDLYDTIISPVSMIDIAIRFAAGLLRPLAEGLQPTSTNTAMLRGDAANADDLSYHLTLGKFALSVELCGTNDQELELLVRPTNPVPPGWVIRLQEGDVTRTVSSFRRDGLQIDALAEGIYTVSLEHEQEKNHAFQLRLLPDNTEQ